MKILYFYILIISYMKNKLVKFFYFIKNNEIVSYKFN